MQPTFSAENSSGVNVNEIQNSNISIFPNPADNYFTVSSYNLQNVEIEIFNIVGKCVYGNKIDMNSVIDVSGFERGIYIVKLNGDFTEKLIIQ